MKKFLSLVLALVMTMSLVTVSAGAKGFTDDGKITYDEAVAVMSAAKVIDGYGDGSFQPTTLLTRGAAAKIICNLILGPTTASALGADTAPYKDVPTSNVFAGYIAYCQKEGIISGYADGTFKPAASLTGYAFMKMLLGALGYDSSVEGYTGPNWSINVAKQAIAIGLNKGNAGFAGAAHVNREEACLYALNTLKATMVEYPQSTTVTVNGADVVLSSSRKEVSWGTALKTNDGHIKKDGYVQFAEKYFPDLELQIGNGIYGRPANTWKNKKAEVGTFTSIEPTYVYTKSMEEGDVYKDLGATITNEKVYDWTYYINGVEQKSGTIPAKNSENEWAYTGEGTVTEIYVNDTEESVTVVEYNYYLGQVSKVKTDSKGEYITVSALSKGAKGLDSKTFYANGFKEDDYVVFTMDENDDKDMVIGEVFEAKTVTGTVTRVDKDTDNAGTGKVTGETYLKMGNDKYVYAEDAKDPAQQSHMVYDLNDMNTAAHPTLDKNYVLYLDPNGYVLGYAAADKTVNQYLYVLDSDEELRDWIAKVYLPDGTKPKVSLDDELSKVPSKQVNVESLSASSPVKFDKTGNSIEWIDNTTGDVNPARKDRTNVDGLIWKYSVDSKGVYSLTYVPVGESSSTGLTQWYLGGYDKQGTAEIHNGKAYVTSGNNTFIVDSKTLFVDTMNGVTYTGYKEVPNVAHAKISYVLDGKVASVVFILDGDIYDSSSTYFMLKDTKRESFRYDGSDYWTYTNAYVNGEKTALNIKYNASSNGVLKADTLYKVTKTVDEKYITEVTTEGMPDKKDVVTVGIDAFWAGSEQNSSNKYDVNNDTVFVVVDYDKDGKLSAIYDGRLSDMNDRDYTVKVQVLKQDEQTAKLVYIYRQEKAAPSDETGITEILVKGMKAEKQSDGSYSIMLPSTKNVGSVPRVAVTTKDSGATYTVTKKDGSSYSNSNSAFSSNELDLVVKVTAVDGSTKSYDLKIKVVEYITLTLKTSDSEAMVSVNGEPAVHVNNSDKYPTVDVAKDSTVKIEIIPASGKTVTKVESTGNFVSGSGNSHTLVASATADVTITLA